MGAGAGGGHLLEEAGVAAVLRHRHVLGHELELLLAQGLQERRLPLRRARRAFRDGAALRNYGAIAAKGGAAQLRRRAVA